MQNLYLPFNKNVSEIKDLKNLSETLVKSFKQPQIVLLKGDLGSGKTQMVRFMCLALGVSSNEIQSPSFSFINQYKTNKENDLPVYHVDLFRLKEEGSLEQKGFWDIFNEPCKVVFIEWSDSLKEPLPEWPTLSFTFEVLDKKRMLKGQWS